MVDKLGKKRERSRTRKDRISLPAPGERVVPSSREALKLQALARSSHDKRKRSLVENWGLNPEQVGGPVAGNKDACAAPLPAFAGATVRRDIEGKPRGAWFANPFKRLGDSSTLTAKEQTAGQNLVDIYAISKGLDGGPEARPKLDQIDGGDPDAWGREDRKQYHIKLFARIIQAMSAPGGRLMTAFCVAMIEEDRPLPWLDLVKSVTGRNDLDRRRASERIKFACEELVVIIPRETLAQEMELITAAIEIRNL